MSEQLQRLPAEVLFQKEIDALIAAEKYPVPEGWKMSPRSVLTYILGGDCEVWKLHQSILEADALWKLLFRHW